MAQKTTTLRRLQLAELDIAKEIRRICEKNSIRYFLVGGTLLGAVRHQGFIPWDDDMDIGMLRPDYERFLSCAASQLKEKYLLARWDSGTDYALPFAKVQLRDSCLEDPTTQGLNLSHGIWVDIFPYDALPQKVAAYGWYRLRLKLYFLLNELKCGYRLEKSYQCPAWRAAAYRALRVVAKLTRHRNYCRKFEQLACRYAGKNGFLCETSGLMNSHFIFPADYFTVSETLSFEGESFSVPGKYCEYLRHAYGDYEQLPPEDQRVAWHNVKQIRFSEDSRNAPTGGKTE